ncbi:QueT transporter family protein [bacterium]|nr:QueT transporter family protein [bacterium]MCI0604199.1 QueT transporter family protein [bacterium]
MRELIRCWQHTRMIVLIALCAALYVAVLLPFKIATIIPGITEVRPAMALPIFFSIFFGPVSAWGTAFGNLIGDVLGGTIGPGSIPGFFGNILYGLIPYRVLKAYIGSRDQLRTRKGWAVFVFAVVLASAVCAVLIATGVDLIGIPFGFLVHTIFLNNLLVSLLLAPLLIGTLGKRIREMKLTYEQILQPQEISNPNRIGPVIVLVLTLILYVLMFVPSVRETLPFLVDHKSAFQIVACVLLFIATLILI